MQELLVRLCLFKKLKADKVEIKPEEKVEKKPDNGNVKVPSVAKRYEKIKIVLKNENDK